MATQKRNSFKRVDTYSSSCVNKNSMKKQVLIETIVGVVILAALFIGCIWVVSHFIIKYW